MCKGNKSEHKQWARIKPLKTKTGRGKEEWGTRINTTGKLGWEGENGPVEGTVGGFNGEEL